MTDNEGFDVFAYFSGTLNPMLLKSFKHNSNDGIFIFTLFLDNYQK